MSKLKTFKLYWSAQIEGVQVVEAFDEDDAREQFDSLRHIDDMDDSPIYGELDDVVEVKLAKNSRHKIKKKK